MGEAGKMLMHLGALCRLSSAFVGTKAETKGFLCANLGSSRTLCLSQLLTLDHRVLASCTDTLQDETWHAALRVLGPHVPGLVLGFSIMYLSSS